MSFNGWDKTVITTDTGKSENGIAPIIISASRATDIPAFHADWFIHRLERGYIKWINPFNQKPQYVSFKQTRVIVFWSKNPKPMLKHLDIIEKKNINFYFTYTINDYKNLEPNVPPLEDRIKTFIELSNRIGKDRVIWRFDPLILTDSISVKDLLEKIKLIGDQLYKYTNKLIISFADICDYKKVQNNLKKSSINYYNFTPENIQEIAEGLYILNKKWHLCIATCAENINLEKYGITANKCIDDDLMIKCFSNDSILMKFLGYSNTEIDLFSSSLCNQRANIKDPGQRSACGCIASKDIGQYNTCMHLCKYCYANSSPNVIKNNFSHLSKIGDSILI